MPLVGRRYATQYLQWNACPLCVLLTGFERKPLLSLLASSRSSRRSEAPGAEPQSSSHPKFRTPCSRSNSQSRIFETVSSRLCENHAEGTDVSNQRYSKVLILLVTVARAPCATRREKMLHSRAVTARATVQNSTPFRFGRSHSLSLRVNEASGPQLFPSVT